MKKKSGFTLVELFIVIILMIPLAGTCVINAIQFAKCDFKAPFKREIVKGIGIIPGPSIVTVFMNPDDTPKVPVK